MKGMGSRVVQCDFLPFFSCFYIPVASMLDNLYRYTLNFKNRLQFIYNKYVQCIPTLSIYQAQTRIVNAFVCFRYCILRFVLGAWHGYK